MKKSSLFRRLFKIHLYGFLAGGIALFAFLMYLYSTLPPLVTVEDYKPSLVSEVYSRDGKKVGEFYREEVRKLVAYEDIPETVIQAFIAAEDGHFFEHHGFNYYAILRALWVNVTSGQKRQGASTITQQAARTVSLTLEKTYTRKLREVLMTIKMEQNLSKEEILYLYLNQIYLGHGSYGVGAAAETYFRKSLKELTLAEISLIAGLPPAPQRFNPIRHPDNAKTKQAYVLKRMVDEGFITTEQAETAKNEVVSVYTKKSYKRVGPHYVETARQILFDLLGENTVLEEGLKVTLAMDYEAQVAAQEAINRQLRVTDKRRGYKGPKSSLNLEDQEVLQSFLEKGKASLLKDKQAVLEIQADGTIETGEEFAEFHKKDSKGEIVSNLPSYADVGQIVEAVVTEVNDRKKYVVAKFAEAVGVIPLEDMNWARDFNPEVYPGDYLLLKKPSQALKPGSVIDVRIVSKLYRPLDKKGTSKKFSKEYLHLALEQEPDLETALLSFDLKTSDILAMVGGYDFFSNSKYHPTSKFNRTYQSRRQVGSGFKPLVFAAGLEKGLTPATPIMDAPIVYGAKNDQQQVADNQEEKDLAEPNVWKPKNYSGKFSGDVLMRTALKRSINSTAIRVMQTATVPFAAEYARRMGVVSPLNLDLSLALGSSGTTLYEMTKAFAVLAKLGKRIRPILIQRVESHSGELLLENVSLDHKFQEQLELIEEEFETKRDDYQKALASYKESLKNRPISEEGQEEKLPEPPKNHYFFSNPNQLISPKTAFLMTNMLQGVVSDADGTGRRAASLGHPAAGKTGTTDKAYDTWFLGYTAHAMSTVWVGYDQEKTVGRGEAGGKTALPIWIDYMKAIHEDKEPVEFEPPAGIVYVAVNEKTGKRTEDPEAMQLPFVEGTEPGSQPISDVEKQVEEKSFLRENF